MNRVRPVLRAVVLLLTLACGAGSLRAQSVGSILGQVTSSAGEPLRGAQVSVDALRLSALAGADGRFVLGAVPAGEHAVRVQMLGYAPVIVARVRVGIGRATELRVQLETSPVPVQALEVTAERVRLVEADVNSSHEVVTGRELRELPVDRLDQVLSLTTGVSDGHFRGGRIGQETYVVDGLSVKNQLEGSAHGATLEYSPAALEEVEVVTGGFGSEYGSALSGVVNYLTRRGSRERWQGRAALRGDAGATGTGGTGFNALSLSAGGPLAFLGEGTTVFADVLGQGMADADPHGRGATCLGASDLPVELAARLAALQANASTAPLYCAYSNRLLPHDAGDKLIGFLRLDRPAGPLTITATLLGNRLQRQLFTPEFKYNPLYQLGQRTEGALATLTLDWTRNIAERTRHAQLRLAGSRLDRYLGALDPASVPERVSVAGLTSGRYRFLGESFTRSPADVQSAAASAVPGYIPRGGMNGSPYGPAGEGLFYTVGTPDIANWTRSDFIGADALGELYTSAGAVGRGGVSARVFRVASYERTDAASPSSTFRLQQFYPATFSAFAESQWVTPEQVRFQVGVRLEGFRSGLDVPLTDSAGPLAARVGTGWKLAFMPRLGASMPVPGTRGRTVARFNYSRLAQPPDFQYFLDTTLGDSLRTSIRRQGNPNLSFETGNSYELGLTQLLNAHLSGSFTAFRKQLENLVAGDVVFGGASDPTFSMSDYGAVTGVELTLRGQWPLLSLRAGYALQKAVGISSGALGDTVVHASDTRVEYPLAFDRRHSLDLSFMAGRAAGAERRWGVAVSANARSGYPIDRRQEASPGAALATSYLPWTSDLSARASYEIGRLPGCAHCRWRITADGRNLLGVENLLALRRDDGQLGPPVAVFNQLEHAVEPANGAVPVESPLYSSAIDLNHDGVVSIDEFRAARFAATLDRFDPSLYFGEPRQLRAGVEVSF